MEVSPTIVSHRHAMIANTLNRFAWAYDRADFDLLARCLAPQARLEMANVVLDGRDAVMTEMRARREKYEAGRQPWHVVSNIIMEELSDVRMTVISRFCFAAIEPDKPAGFSSFGWYDDEFVQEDGVWLIDRRRMRKSWDR